MGILNNVLTLIDEVKRLNSNTTKLADKVDGLDLIRGLLELKHWQRLPRYKPRLLHLKEINPDEADKLPLSVW